MIITSHLINFPVNLADLIFLGQTHPKTYVTTATIMTRNFECGGSLVRVDNRRPEGRGFESRSNRHVGWSFTCSFGAWA